MYHIFLVIAAISSQNQLAHIKEQFEKKIERRSVNEVRPAEISKIKNDIPNIGISAEKRESTPDNIISQLTQKVIAEESATIPDLESLGLDLIDDISSAKNVDGFLTGNLTNIDNKPKTKPEEVKPEEVKPEEVKPSTTRPEDQTQTIKESNQTIIKENAQKFISKIIIKPASQIKDFLSEKLPDDKKPDDKKPNDKEILTAEAPEKEVKTPEPEKTKPKSKINQQNKKRATNHHNKVKEFRINEKEMQKRIAELRQKYLQNNDEDRYREEAAVVVPRRKEPPKFINQDVASPLLNRFRGQENKHHPFYISEPEKVNFLFMAIKEGRIDDFNSILNLVEDPNIKNSVGDTLLTFSILMRKYEAISSLIAKGANTDLENNLGYRPLNIAIEMSDYKAASILVDIGDAQVNLIDDLGRSYLMQAARVGSLPIVDLLIRKGADLNLADNIGNTALEVAYQNKQDIVAKYLLKYGAKTKSPATPNHNDQYDMVNDLFYKWK